MRVMKNEIIKWTSIVNLVQSNQVVTGEDKNIQNALSIDEKICITIVMEKRSTEKRGNRNMFVFPTLLEKCKLSPLHLIHQRQNFFHKILRSAILGISRISGDHINNNVKQSNSLKNGKKENCWQSLASPCRNHCNRPLRERPLLLFPNHNRHLRDPRPAMYRHCNSARKSILGLFTGQHKEKMEQFSFENICSWQATRGNFYNCYIEKDILIAVTCIHECRSIQYFFTVVLHNECGP